MPVARLTPAERRGVLLAAVSCYALAAMPLLLSLAALWGVSIGSGVALPLLWIGAAMLVLRQINGFVVSGFYHRALSHGSVTFAPWLTTLLRVWGWYFLGSGGTTWAAVHRWHHATADTADDPHSPTRPGSSYLRVVPQALGTFHATARDRSRIAAYTRGLPDDRLERFFQGEERRFFGVLGVRIPSGLALTSLFFWLGLGLPPAWSAVAALACLPGVTGAVMSSTILIVNGLGHTVGYRNFDTRDTSTNVLRWDVLHWGEALHNNHHAMPGAANMALPGELDLGYLTLRLMKRIGWVTALGGEASPETRRAARPQQ